MPRKPRITAVPVEQPQEEGLATAWGDEEGITDADQMTDIISKVNVGEEVLEKEYNPPNELTAPVAPKAKAKRAPRSSL